MEQAGQLSPEEYRYNLLALANFYIQGYTIDFYKLHEGESNLKISLPTYPFMKKRYWVKVTNKIDKPSSQVQVRPKKEEELRKIIREMMSDNLSIKEANSLILKITEKDELF